MRRRDESSDDLIEIERGELACLWLWVENDVYVHRSSKAARDWLRALVAGVLVPLHGIHPIDSLTVS
jgi:hypothetical protein